MMMMGSKQAIALSIRLIEREMALSHHNRSYVLELSRARKTLRFIQTAGKTVRARKRDALELLQTCPGLSYSEIGRLTGLHRKTVSGLLKNGTFNQGGKVG